MLAVLSTLTPCRQNKFIDCQRAKVPIAVLPIMDVKTWWNSIMELLEQAFRLQQFTHERLNNPKYSDYRPLFTTQDEWTIVKCIMDVLKPFRYWTLWIWNGHMVALHHVISVYKDMFNHMVGVLWALAKTQTQRKVHLYLAAKFARQTLSKCHAEVTPMTGMVLISAPIMDPFWKL